jgi:Fic family protein
MNKNKMTADFLREIDNNGNLADNLSYYELLTGNWEDLFIAYDKLNNISSKGDWDAWIIYFLKAVKEQSELNIKRAKSILNLYNTKKEEIKEATGSQYSINILDFIFSYPFFSTSQFSLVTKVKQSYSKDLIKKLEKKGIIKLLRTSTGSNPNIYFFPELLRITG